MHSMKGIQLFPSFILINARLDCHLEFWNSISSSLKNAMDNIYHDCINKHCIAFSRQIQYIPAPNMVSALKFWTFPD